MIYLPKIRAPEEYTSVVEYIFKNVESYGNLIDESKILENLKSVNFHFQFNLSRRYASVYPIIANKNSSNKIFCNDSNVYSILQLLDDENILLGEETSIAAVAYNCIPAIKFCKDKRYILPGQRLITIDVLNRWYESKSTPLITRKLELFDKTINSLKFLSYLSGANSNDIKNVNHPCSCTFCGNGTNIVTFNSGIYFNFDAMYGGMTILIPYSFCEHLLREIWDFGKMWILLSVFTVEPFDVIPEINTFIKYNFLHLTIADTFSCSEVTEYVKLLKPMKAQALKRITENHGLKKIKGTGSGKNGQMVKVDYIELLKDRFIMKRGKV